MLLDAGSQQTFITQRVVDELKLKPLREINMEVSSFLSKKEGVMKLKEYELNVKNMDSSSGKLIKCSCVPKKCPNIKGQSVKQELKKRHFIKTLKLADSITSKECSIDMLIGSGIYLSLVNSIFDWLISGPIECSKQENEKTVTLTTTHMLKIGCYAANDERSLKENISKFWDLDAVGIKDNEISVYEKFKDDIKFENNSYSVKLPVKEFHPIEFEEIK